MHFRKHPRHPMRIRLPSGALRLPRSRFPRPPAPHRRISISLYVYHILRGAGELARAMAIAAAGLDESPDSPAPCAQPWPVGAVRLPCSAGARCRTVLSPRPTAPHTRVCVREEANPTGGGDRTRARIAALRAG